MITIKTYQKTTATNSSGGAPIYIRFYLDREKIDLATGITVPVGKFSETSFVSKTISGYRDKNLLIESIKSRITDIVVKFRLSDRKLTKASFFRSWKSKCEYDHFIDFAIQHIKSANDIEATTKEAHLSVVKKLSEYSPFLEFDEIDSSFIRKYLKYMTQYLGNSEATAHKNLSTLKKYIRLAIKEKLIDIDPFVDVKIRSFKSKVVYLTEDELQLLFNAYKDKELSDTHYKALEFFLFMCFTSLHITDARKLDLSQIEEQKFTYWRIKNRNSKPEPILIPLSNPAKEIIANVKGKRNSGSLFKDLMTDQRINLYIKEVAERYGIEKNLTAKVGRHTFATIYLRKTRDLASLKEILGHSQIRETLIYAHVLEDSKLEYIQCFNGF